VRQFRSAGGDPAPVGTDHFLRATAGLADSVATRAISEEAIAPGNQIMHMKYMIRDGQSTSAAVWTGSTNFTVDAWALQENNIVVVSNCRPLAAAYGNDFQALWDSEKLAGTGVGDQGTATVSGQAIRYAFAPGEGKQMETRIAKTISGTTKRLRIASMVTSSQKILTALKSQIDADLDFAGVYDYDDTQNVRSTWQRTGHDDKVSLLDAVSGAMVAKRSLTYSPQNVHNFLHDKVAVADKTVVTGSFNLSLNATRNAENILIIENETLADTFARYIDQLVERYGSGTS
jgi:phosphatidylserine/phosphatidylglycerophosphate/cardiolipin synthase-like enzyme